MAELPSPPSLDLDGAAEEPAANAPAATASPKPVPAPAPAPTPQAEPTPAPLSTGTAPAKMATQPAVASEPSPVPAPAHPPENVELSMTGSGVQDSVEEVLQQTSAQTLQLSHLEDVLSALNQTLTDLQDEMHAGFAEIRAVTESVGGGEGSRRTEIAGGESMTQRIEFLEEQTLETNKKQNLVTILAVGQGVLLIILLVVVLAGMRSGPTTEIPDATYTTSSSPTVEETEKPPPPVLEEPRKKKRRRKR